MRRNKLLFKIIVYLMLIALVLSTVLFTIEALL